MLLRVARPRIRPPGYVSLRANRSHRLVGDAVMVFAFGGQFGLGRELLSGARLLSTNNAPSVGLTEEGPSFTNPANTDQISSEFHLDSWNVVGDLTVAWRGLIANTSYRYIAGKIPLATGGGQNTPWSLEHANPTAGRFGLTRSHGSDYRVWQQNTSLAGTGSVQAVSVSQGSAIQNGPLWYVNGTADGSTSQYSGGASGAPTGNTNFVTMGLRPDSGTSAQFYSHLLIVLPRQWSADEHTLWNLAPWGVVEESARYYFATPIAGGDVTVSLTGIGSTGAAGTLTTSSSVALSGASSTGSPGTVVATRALAMTGEAATASGGTVAPTRSLPLSGQSVTPAAGTLGAGLSLALGGEAITASQGTVTVGNGITVSLTGSAVTASVGTLSVARSIAVSGQSSAFTAGTLIPGLLAALSGSSASVSAGTLGVTRALSLAGAAASWSLGTVSLDGGTATMAPASRTVTWPWQARQATWTYDQRVIAWPARSRTVTWEP